jgi:hypothetical protein
MIFWREKETVPAGLRLKKQQWEMRDCPWRPASWRHNCTGTGYSSTVLFWLFRKINGDKVATVLVFKSADNEQGNIVGRFFFWGGARDLGQGAGKKFLGGCRPPVLPLCPCMTSLKGLRFCVNTNP